MHTSIPDANAVWLRLLAIWHLLTDWRKTESRVQTWWMLNT